jgi:type IV pilus assembly protein PilM
MGGSLVEQSAFEETLDHLLERLSTPAEEASLVLPDEWIRVSFVTVDELPGEARARDEILRWKLRRVVPFRVDELRLNSAPVAPLPKQKEKHRRLVSFAVDSLLRRLEEIFAKHGIRLGQVSSQSLCLSQAVALELEEAELAALLMVQPQAYTLVFYRHGELVVHRHKGFGGEPENPTSREIVSRDLQLTRKYLEEHLEHYDVDRILLVAPEGWATDWQDWVEDGLGCRPQLLDPASLPVAGPRQGIDWLQLGPLLGAACREVA